MATPSKVEQWYDKHAELEEHRLDEGRLEFEVTMRVIKTCIEQLGIEKTRILDVGGGPGRYAIELAEKGHDVKLNDLSSENLAIARKNAETRNVSLDAIVHANALNITAHPSLTHAQNSFDIVLCLGPLYHLLDRSDRTRVLQNCITLTKPGGYILASYISIFAHLRDVARRDPARLHREWDFYARYIQSGEYTRNVETESWHVDPGRLDEEITGVVAAGEVVVERVLSCEGFLGFEGARGLAGLGDEVVGRWVDVVLKSAEWREVRGAADHVLVVFRKI